MLKYRLLILPALWLLSYATNAQTEAILNDPEVTWAAVVYVDINLNEKLSFPKEKARPPYAAKRGPYRLLKFREREEPLLLQYPKNPGLHQLSIQVFKNRKAPTFPIYEDEALQREISPKELDTRFIDSFMVFGEGFQERYDYSNRLDRAAEDGYLRVRQLLYYKAKEDLLYSKILAATILDIKYTENGNKLYFEPTFWFPVKELNHMPDLAEEALIIVQGSTFRQQLPNASEVLKSKQSFSTVGEQLLQEVQIFNEGKAGERHYYRADNSLLQPGGLNDSTKIGFDSQTFAEVKKVQAFDASEWKVEGLQFNRIWAWDDEKKELLVYTYAFSPYCSSTKGQEAQLFYRYYSDAKH